MSGNPSFKRTEFGSLEPKLKEPKLYDCFLFLNEFELLDMRLKYLDSVVDYFIIVEGSHTFSAQPKSFLLQDYKFPIDRKKIIYLPIAYKPEPNDFWLNEFCLRNSLSKGIRLANNEDIIMISDVDEIPNKELLTKDKLRYIKYDNQYSFQQDLYYFL